MISVGKTIKFVSTGVVIVGLATGCATAKKGEMAEPAAVSTAVVTEEVVTETMGPGSYTVVKGDNLWDISDMPQIYDNPYDWPIIYSHNRNQIKVADRIYPGQVFTIPNEFKPREVANARSFARTRGAWENGAAAARDAQFLAENPM